MNSSPETMLAIESAICGGSLALIKDLREVSTWVGTSSVSKAEDLLANIDILLTENKVSRNELDMIAVSAGPGSFTGIRIGIATALGLKAGLEIKMKTVSVLESMVVTDTPAKLIVTSAVPIGRNMVCFQSFKIGDGSLTEVSKPETSLEADFIQSIKDKREEYFLLHSTLFEKGGSFQNTQNFEGNLATAVGINALLSLNQPDHEPMFISTTF